MSDLMRHLRLSLSLKRRLWLWLFAGIFLILGAGALPNPESPFSPFSSLSAPSPSLEQAAVPAQKLQSGYSGFALLPAESLEALLPPAVGVPARRFPLPQVPAHHILKGQPQFLPRPPPFC